MRAGSWVLAAAVAAGFGFALWTGSSVSDPVGRGSAAPPFSLPERPGPGEMSLDSLRGEVVLLNFWATWCEPCEREMPEMERLYQRLRPAGLRLVAVSVDDTESVVVEFGRRFALSFDLLWDPEKRVSDAYQAYKYPETLLIDRDGIVVERYVGPREWDSPLYEARLRRLLEGKDPS